MENKIMHCKEDELISYACSQFENGVYDKALEAFVFAYERGYQQTWILENIYNCYMSANDNEFRDTYREQTPDVKMDYNECILDFIPYRDGEYFIFDKEERIFLGLFSIPVLQRIKQDSVFDEMEYSAAVIALDWDLREESDILAIAQQRKIYIVCKDSKRFLSFWKIPELKNYLENIIVFFNFIELQEYFHKNTAVYLPMIIRGGDKESKILAKIRGEEHQYRLTPEGRNTNNVLLTIAIPTANRGNLLLKRLENLLSMPYDAEIEIAVSKNCCEKYEEEYKQASNITDARLHYYDHGKELQGYQSFHYAIKMSCGKYVLLVSDEDDVVLNSIEHYLKVLSSNPEISVIRAKSKYFYSGIMDRKYAKQGIDAFDLMFLAQNYLSSLIIRRKDFSEDDYLKDPEVFAKNIFFQYYPHECWCVILSYRGDALKEPVRLISEGKSVNEGFFPNYASYSARLEQLEGIIDFLRLVMEGDIEGTKVGLITAINKTGYLLKMARNLNYNCNDYMHAVDQYIFVCTKAIESFSFDKGQKAELMGLLDYCNKQALAVDK